MTTDLVGQLIIYIVVLLLAISVHEAGHAWMSYKFGDDTAYMLGRVTLNPVAHTDPIGTLLIPTINFIAAVGAGVFVPLIGWGKPTPVNPLKWRKKDLANVMVSLAGIMANLILATIAFVILKVGLLTGTIGNSAGRLGSFDEPVFMLLLQVLLMNVSLAVFNILPIPPLDGSKILYSILPESAHSGLEALERFGYIILIAAVYFGFVSEVIAPVRRFVFYLLLS
jgi:Zn-dependent protease